MRRLHRLGCVWAALAGFVPAVSAQPIQNVADGTANGYTLGGSAVVTLNRLSSVASDAIAEISPNEVTMGATGVEFVYDIVPVLNAGDTGPGRVEVTAPTGYTNLAVTEVRVNGTPLAASCPGAGAGQYCATIAGSTMTIELGDRVTTNLTPIRVTFTADAPALPGTASFDAALVDRTLTAPARAGDADGDAGDANSTTVEVLPNQGVVLNLVKSADRGDVVVGEPVTYRVEIRNVTDVDVTDVRVDDLLPPNFRYVEGSARIDGALVPDPEGPRPLRFPIGTMPAPVDGNGNGTVDPGETGYLVLSYQVVVGAGARPGRYVSRAVATDFCDVCYVSNPAEHEIEVRLDELFDLGLVIGKVFLDRNRDGWQDPDEPGVGGAVVALDDGTYAITDEHGRYHLPALVPGQRLVKIDLANLGGGAVATTDESRVLTLTPGLTARANFGIEMERHDETIGTPAQPGLAITGEADPLPVQVLGSAETLAVLVNGDRIRLPSGDVRLSAGELEEVVHVGEDGVADPVAFRLDLDFGRDVERWNLSVRDGRDEVVWSAAGEGEPPAALGWDGRTERGGVVEIGKVYHYRLEVVTRDGIRWASPRRLFGVNRRSFISVRLTGDSFASNEVALSPAARHTLREAGEVLRRHPEERFVIEGHTDSRGPHEHNLELSRRRAEAARDFFTEEMGLPADRFTLRWFGEDRPIASENEAGWAARNRRVVIRAEMEEVHRANLTDGLWSEPTALVNGRALSLDGDRRFSTTLDGAATTEVDVAVTNPEGRTAAARIRLPGLEILEPLGVHRVPFGATRDGFTVAERGAVGDVIATASVVGRTEPGNVVEVAGVAVPTEANGRFSTIVDLRSGDNGFGVVARGPNGFRRIVNLDVRVADRDENGEVRIETDVIPNLTVWWPPADGPLKTTKLRVTGTTDPENEIAVNGEPWEVRPDGTFGDLVEVTPGTADVEVAVTDPQGRTGRLARTYAVSENQIFLVAFADGIVGRLEGDGYLEGAGLEESSEWYTTGRVSYYLKGLIRGRYLVKSAYDSGHRDIEPIFGDLDEVRSEHLIRNLDPDKFYPVYGDDSEVVWDAETLGRFYLAVDAEEWSVLVGNYPVTLTDTELGAYQRTLYGGKAVYQRASREEGGPPDTQILVFGAELDQIHVRDEVRATGGSLYFLSHADLVEGSEQVAIVVRDKVTGLVLSRRQQRRGADYTIKYPEGRVLFQRPISSVVLDDLVVDPEILSGNPVTIEVAYETWAEAFEETAAGARAKQRLPGGVTVGGTFVDDHPEAGPYRLGAVDAEVRVAGSRVVAEYAHSEGTGGLTFLSEDGGLTYVPATRSAAVDGHAWRAAAELDVGRLRLKGYHKRLDPGFVSAGNFLERGTRRSGASGSLRVTDRNTLLVSHDRDNRTGDAQLAGALDEAVTTTAQWNHLRERWGLHLEWYRNESKDPAGLTLRESELAAAEATVRLGDDLTGRAQYQRTLSGDENDQLTLGAEYRAHRNLALEARGTVGTIGSSAQAGAVLTTGDTRVYLAERLVDDSAGHATSTVVGAESFIGPRTKVYSEYQRESATAGDRNVALIGASREIPATEDVTLVVSGEHSHVDADAGDRERSAIAGRLSYDAGRGFRALTRNEYRIENGVARSQQFLTSNHVDVKVNPDYTVLGKYRYSRTTDRDTNADRARLEEASVGVAYRPVGWDRINGLTRYTYLRDRRPTALEGEDPVRRKLNVFSLDTIVDVHRRVEWVTKGAARIRTERAGDRPALTTHTYLAIQRLNGNFWGPFDLGLEYRILAQRETDDREQGWLTDVMWKLHPHFRVGAGFNFTDFSDNEFTMNDYSVRGWFLRAQGRY